MLINDEKNYNYIDLVLLNGARFYVKLHFTAQLKWTF